GSVAKTFALQLGAAVPTLAINATTIAFGDVDLNTPATQSVTLTSAGTATVTVSAATVSGSGFTVSGAAFPLTLNPNQAVTLSVEFDPTTAGAVSGSLTITSNSSTGSSSVITLTGTGQTATSYEVNLTWDAPSSSSDPVAGYNVYRAPSGGTAYQQLNASAITQTTYVDTTVQAGQTYDYIVESVDALGVTSVPSNMASVTTP
ncbi:MAG: choice-of-anchor D domain-containing protein, partial [Terracidiphilus sp.]